MRLVNVDGRVGILTDEGVVDVFELTDGAYGPDIRSCLDEWIRFRKAVDSADHRSSRQTRRDIDESSFGPPVPEPRQVFAVGLNYADHVAEANAEIPDVPVVFTKFPSSLAGPGMYIELPSASVDFEAELVVVMGTEARNVDADEAWDHVAGLMVGQDVSERAVQMSGGGAQASLAKSLPGFSPCGPALVTLDEIPSPDDLSIGCRVGDEILQQSRTGQMIFSVPQIISYISRILPLLPGDLIFTGTPSGIGATRKPPRFLRAGEVLVTEIECLGRLANPLAARNT